MRTTGSGSVWVAGDSNFSTTMEVNAVSGLEHGRNLLLTRALSLKHSERHFRERLTRARILLHSDMSQCHISARALPAAARDAECRTHCAAGPPSTDVMLARALHDYDELDGLNVPVPGGYQVP